jgi:hypothetical protein
MAEQRHALDGLEMLAEQFGDFRITFVRGLQEQEVLRRFGGDLALAWSLPLAAFDQLKESLEDLDEAESLQDIDLTSGDAVLQAGTCGAWGFALEWVPHVTSQRLLTAISSGTTAVSVERISSTWLRLLDWAEDGVYRDGCEASGPFSPQMQRLIEQAGVALEGEGIPLGDTLFAPLLEKVFHIHLTRKALDKPLLTGVILHIPGEYQ